MNTIEVYREELKRGGGTSGAYHLFGCSIRAFLNAGCAIRFDGIKNYSTKICCFSIVFQIYFGVFFFKLNDGDQKSGYRWFPIVLFDDCLSFLYFSSGGIGKKQKKWQEVMKKEAVRRFDFDASRGDSSSHWYKNPCSRGHHHSIPAPSPNVVRLVRVAVWFHGVCLPPSLDR